MGEATYYLKARFESETVLAKKLPEIKKFIQECADAQDYWQDNRNGDSEVFWTGFKEKFPLVTKYLGKLVDGDHNNGLSGMLSFNSPDEEASLNQNGAILLYSAYVWHFAEWDTFAKFLEDHFGAIVVSWVSDEYIDVFDCINI